jgi:ABC-2 type transport system ATP-binding protein
MTTTTITVDRLTKRYGATTAVDDLSFAVPAGSVTGFLGPNGAGKSTTLRALLGLTRPTAGRATFDGVPYGELADPAGTVGAMLEHDPFHPSRSGRDHLRVLATAAGIAPGRVDEVLGQVGLADAAGRASRSARRVPVGGYSLGMRRRLGLAAALLGDPSVLLLDEPANGLDPQGIRWLRDLLRDRAGRGVTVLVSSHVLSEVALIAERVVVVHRGRLVTSGPVGELTAGGRTLEDVFLELTDISA